MTILALVVHVLAGLVGLVSGTVAAFARKGARLHRLAGNIFFVAMSVMALFAAYLAVAVPDQRVNVFISAFTVYMVGTGWLTVRRKGRAIGLAEWIALVFAVAIAAPFIILSAQLAAGLPPLFRSAVPFKGPVLVAIYAFTAVLVIAAVGDAKVALGGGVAGVSRIARHLWRMCFGLTLAAGSAFTNGFARLLPGPYHVPPVFFLPQLLPILLLIVWMIRLRLTGWFDREGAARLQHAT
jgi:uncharacterized membrane protein